MSDQFKKASILKDANTSYSISTQKMSEQVKRYVPVDRHGVSALMQEDAEFGGWVRVENYELAALEHATLQAEYRRVRDNQNTLIARVRLLENELASSQAECERLRADNGRLIEDRARFPDKPDFIGNMIAARFGNLRAGQAQAEKFAASYRSRMERAELECERLHAEVLRLTPNPADFRYWEGRYRDEASANDALRAKLAAIKAQQIYGYATINEFGIWRISIGKIAPNSIPLIALPVVNPQLTTE